MVHEPYVAMEGPKLFVLGSVQRAQLEAIKAVADIVLTPTHDAARRTKGFGSTPHVVPVGSNLPDRRGDREAVRAALGIESQEPVFAVLGRSLRPHQRRLIGAALAEAATSQRCHLLLLGTGMDDVPQLPATVTVHRPGPLPWSELAGHMAAADLYLATYPDGVSTRRTSLMGALQHGLPVVGTTVGRSDPELLASDGLLVLPEDGVSAFADAARRLARDSDERNRRGRAARALYDRSFSWPSVARRMAEALELPVGASR